MFPKFKRQLKIILAPLIIPLILLGIIGLIILVQPKIRSTYWWSVIFTNPIKQTNGATNLLLLGVSGGSYVGADLTDTMIFLSINQKTGKIIMVSLPRDIWSPTLVAKINTAYHYGEEKQKGQGLTLAKSTAEEIVGLPIHYVVKIDLAGLDDIVNFLGGVEVNIDQSFDDYKYPIEGKEEDLCAGDIEYKCRYQHVHFDAGKQVLNGERALQYVRSRNAEGDEGTDFARSKRQEKLLLAIKNKVFSLDFLSHPQKVLQLIKIVGTIIETDIPQGDFPYWGKILLKTNFNQIKTLNLEELLINPPTWQYGQWVLVPRTGDFLEIQQFLKKQIPN